MSLIGVLHGKSTFISLTSFFLLEAPLNEVLMTINFEGPN